MPARRRSQSASTPEAPKKKGPPVIIGPLTGPSPDLMIPVEAAGHLRMAVSGLYERTARADDPTRSRDGGHDPIPAIRVGRTLRYRRVDLDAWLARRLSTPAKLATAGKR